MAQYCDVVFPLKSNRRFSYLTGACSEHIRVGQRVIVPFGRREKTGFVVGLSDDKPVFPEIKPVSRVLDNQPLISEKLFLLAAWMSEYYCAPLGEVLRFMLTSAMRPPARPVAEDADLYQGILPEMAHPASTPEQAGVLDALQKLFGGASKKPAVLQGVAASGKTEIYLRLADFVSRELNGQSLILVPEILLVPQIENWARERFGGKAAVLHSGLTPREHYRLFLQAQAGDITVVIGTRSAVFCPFANLKLIVVDEEFDRAYKENRSPRYHARDVAVKRAEIEDAQVILASATLSLESYQAAQSGRFHSFAMTQRVAGYDFPTIRLADLRGHGAKRKRKSPPLISATLRSLIEERMLKAEQAIILVNRRGYSTAFSCPECGHLFQCPRCEVSLVYHRTTGEFYCHYCNYRTEPPAACPACGRAALAAVGFGTQAVERQLKSFFPDAGIMRLDADTRRRKNDQDPVGLFREAKADILVGTQIVAKGHHFPGVTLVGVLGADMVLNLPDFRASERSFQILLQVAGRAGRNLPDAEVYIQTYYPDHYVYACLAGLNLEEFYRKELAFRREVDYPPFGFLANILFTGRQEKTVIRKADEWAALAQEKSCGLVLEVMGPAACFHKKIRGYYRWHLVLKSKESGRIQAFLRSLPEKKFFEHGVAIDIDPIDLF